MKVFLTFVYFIPDFSHSLQSCGRPAGLATSVIVEGTDESDPVVSIWGLPASRIRRAEHIIIVAKQPLATHNILSARRGSHFATCRIQHHERGRPAPGRLRNEMRPAILRKRRVRRRINRSTSSSSGRAWSVTRKAHIGGAIGLDNVTFDTRMLD